MIIIGLILSLQFALVFCSNESAKTCRSNKDCGVSECCIVCSPYLRQKTNCGTCQPRGSHGDECLRYSFWAQYFPGMCPCGAGLQCNAPGSTSQLKGTCQYKRCNLGRDCGDDECCEGIMVKGRKKRQARLYRGFCKPLGTVSGSCLMRYPSGKPSGAVMQCPCQSGLKCDPDGEMIVPQGKTGICKMACRSDADCAPNHCCTPQVKPVGSTGGTCEPLGSEGARRCISKKCLTGKDCGPNECCENNMVRGRKKRAVAPNPGVCKPLGITGGSCLTRYPSGKPAATVMECPCKSHLNCVPDGQRVVPQGYSGVCKVPKECSSGAECGEYECCKSKVRPIGRKKRALSSSLSKDGICEPMGTEGSDCLTRYKPGKPPGMVFACPCITGNFCNGIGTFDAPLGEMGKCRIR